MKHNKTRWMIAIALAGIVSSRVAMADGDLFVGPDVAKEAPVLIDTIGEEETIFRALGNPGTKAKASRWDASLSFWVHYKAIDSDDTVMMQVSKGNKKLGKPAPCNPKKIYKEALLARFECKSQKDRDYDKMFSTDGKHSISLTYKKPVEGKEWKDFATFEVYPVKLKKGSANDPVVAWDTDHDMKLSVTTIEEKTNNGGQDKALNAIAAATRKGIPYMLVHTWFKRSDRLARTKMTCMYNGKRIAEHDATHNYTFDYWTFIKKGKNDRDNPKWIQAEYFLYSLHPRPDSEGGKGTWSVPQHWMNENPGDYRCVITGDGEVLKEITFTVGKDGEIVKPPCQLASVNALRTVTMVAATSKGDALSNTKFDKKRGEQRGYEGRVKWAKGCPMSK